MASATSVTPLLSLPVLKNRTFTFPSTQFPRRTLTVKTHLPSLRLSNTFSAAASSKANNPSGNKSEQQEEEEIVEVEEDLPWIQEKAKRKKLVNKNAVLCKLIDQLFQKGQEEVQHSTLLGLAKKTGLRVEDIFRKYIRYAINEKLFDPELVSNVSQLRKATMLEDRQVDEIFNDVLRRRVKGPVVMNMSGYSEKLAVQSEVNKNAVLCKLIDQLFQKGQEEVQHSTLLGLAKKTGLRVEDIFRKYISYALKEKQFNPELVSNLIQLRKATMLEDRLVAEILNDISSRIVRFIGRVVMNMSGYSEKGFKRKLALQALFGKVFYLSELPEFCSQDSSLVVKDIFGVTDDDADKLRQHTLSEAGDMGSLEDKMVDDSNSPRAKRKKLVNKNAVLCKLIDQLFQKGQEEVQHSTLLGLAKKTGLRVEDIFRKYISYALKEKQFNPELVSNLIQLRKATMLEDRLVAEILNDISSRIVRFIGRVVMNMSGYSEKGFKRKLALQVLFGKVFYLSELPEFISQDSSLVVKDIFGVTDDDADKLRQHTLSEAGDMGSLEDKMVDDSNSDSEDSESEDLEEKSSED